MGGPLSCTMANFYMCHVENQILREESLKPSIYCRYIDDIFVIVRDNNHLTELKEAFISNSVLNFTHELSIDNKLPFLDVMLENRNNELKRSVYTKPTKSQECIKYDCDAPLRYKHNVINTLAVESSMENL